MSFGHRSNEGGSSFAGPAPFNTKCAWRVAAQFGITATGSDAEKIYPRFGWERVGVIPDYALWPQGGFCATTLFYKRVA